MASGLVRCRRCWSGKNWRAGELVMLPMAQKLPNLQVVVSWRVGVELVEEIVGLCQKVVTRYAEEVGEERMVLSN